MMFPCAEADPLHVNWCELTTTNERDGRTLYHNAFGTNHALSDAAVAAGRTCRKVENEGNNTFKTKGYHFEHNFGHRQQHVASFLLTLILLALLCHTSSTCCTPNTSNSAEPWQRAAPFLMISVRSPGYWALTLGSSGLPL